MSSAPLVFAHIGDLHITKAKEQNYIDLLSIVAQIETELGNKLDFVLLPGDNADNGLQEQYNLVAIALKMLSVPVYLLAGDHDMEQGNLHNFYRMPFARPLPLSVTVKGKRCLFIDVCGSGSGGPDFRIGNEQFQWMEQQLDQAKSQGEERLLFMHTFPSDLIQHDEQVKLNQLIAYYGIVLVDMGHTHYNEITNNGQTVFTATRSTGQIEEGPVGYSLISVNQGIVSWRFKHLADPFPFVLVTAPADYRLINNNDQFIKESYQVSAVILGSKKLKRVECRVGTEEWTEMIFDDSLCTWSTAIKAPEQPLHSMTIKATDETGRPGQWTIQPASALYQLPQHVKDGSDADTIGAWPENGVFGTQLGPNSNGKLSS